MPQLNPAPWFLILALTWLIFLISIVPKIASHIFPSAPASQTTSKPNKQPWSW